jgi:hypothetical protein
MLDYDELKIKVDENRWFMLNVKYGITINCDCKPEKHDCLEEIVIQSVYVCDKTDPIGTEVPESEWEKYRQLNDENVRDSLYSELEKQD